MNNRTKILFFINAIIVGLVLAGVLPRSVMLYEIAALAVTVLLIPLEEAVLFFIASIPLFIALPITSTFDNFNAWRVFSILIFAKWALTPATLVLAKETIRSGFKKPWQFVKDHQLFFGSVALLIIAALSVLVASNQSVAIKRIIYFINLSLVGLVIVNLAKTRSFTEKAIRAIVWPTVLVALVGAAQVVLTYFIDIYQFMRIWGEGIQMREFGTLWSYIATHVGNTWFAYYGDQLSLRVFSLFPDSHSFPIFLILGLPTLFAISINKVIEQPTLKAMLHKRAKLSVLLIPLVYLMMILSGTRGIWAAGVAVILWAIFIAVVFRTQHQPKQIRSQFVYLSSYLSLFLILFLVAYPIFSSPQFLVSKSDALLLQHRLKSTFDFGETSNHQRIEIWQKSLTSIAHHPVLGVGIANFPVVLSQNIQLSKAGSSAHNIYLHIAAEIGVLALLISLYLLYLIIVKAGKKFLSADTPTTRIYFGVLLLSIPWVFAYLMTDVALFDERAFLLFVVTLGLLFAND